MIVNESTAQARYEKLSTKREPFLKRARNCSELTIPGLYPPLGSNEFTEFPTPYQSVGAEGVNNLAAKLLLALLPPNSPFFRMRIDESLVVEYEAQDENFRAAIEKALALTEQAVMNEVETSGDRTAFFEAAKHLLVAGNVLLYLPKDSAMRVFRLDRYVVKRTPDGTVLEIITKECTTVDALPKDVRSLLGHDNQNADDEVEIYTHIKKNGNHWVGYQEVKGKKIPGSEAKFPLDKTPYIPLRFERIDNQDYGRSLCEQYYGDLLSLDGLEKSVLEGSAASAKIIVMVAPNGSTSAKDIENAENGDIITGEEQDVTMLQAQKSADLNVAAQNAIKIEQRLQRIFLMFSSAQRNAERVTAEEIKQVISELEERLGGFYSILSQEFQAPYVQRKLFIMQQQNKLPQLPKKLVKPAIVTGLEALGRSQDLQKIRAWGADMQAIFTTELPKYLTAEGYGNRLAAAYQLDVTGILKTEQQLQQEQAAEQKAAMTQQMTPELIKQGGNLIGKGMDNGQLQQVQNQAQAPQQAA